MNNCQNLVGLSRTRRCCLFSVSYLKFSEAPLKAVVSKVYNYINRIVSVILLKLYMECD
jgi:hypothetical protein